MSESARHKSTRAGHPDVGPVLPSFVGRLPGHVMRLRALWAGSDRAGLQGLAHQLRGAGTTFGFEGMTVLAAEVEEMLLAGRSLVEVETAVTVLTAYMGNVEGYPATR